MTNLDDLMGKEPYYKEKPYPENIPSLLKEYVLSDFYFFKEIAPKIYKEQRAWCQKNPNWLIYGTGAIDLNSPTLNSIFLSISLLLLIPLQIIFSPFYLPSLYIHGKRYNQLVEEFPGVNEEEVKHVEQILDRGHTPTHIMFMPLRKKQRYEEARDYLTQNRRAMLIC